MFNWFVPKYESEEDYYRKNIGAPEYFNDSIIAGPKNLGDPDCKKLSVLEERYATNIKKREIICKEQCPDLQKATQDCYQHYPYTKRIRCYDVTKARKECVLKYWDSPGLGKRALDEYLDDRSYYRKTGFLKGEPHVEQKNTNWMRPKTWEEYNEDKNKSFLRLLKEALFGRPTLNSSKSNNDETQNAQEHSTITA